MWKMSPLGFNTLVDSMNKTSKREPGKIDETTTNNSIHTMFLKPNGGYIVFNCELITNTPLLDIFANHIDCTISHPYMNSRVHITRLF